MFRNIDRRTWSELAMLLVAFIWGTTFVMVKNALADIGPFLFLGMRFIIAFMVLALLSFSNMKKIKRSTIYTGCLLGAFLFIGYVTQTIGLKYTTSSNAGFITGLNVVLVPIIFAFLIKKRPAATTILTVLLAAVGMFFLSLPEGSLRLAYGDFLVLICAFAFAFHIVFVDRYSYRHNAVAITGVQVLFVGLVCMAIGLITEPWPQHFTLNAVSAILITSIFATSLAFLLLNALQKHSTPTRFAVVLAMEPVFAAAAGYLWAGEILSSRGLLGAFLILFSMIFSIISRKNENIMESKI